MIAVDTNVLVRLITGDDPKQSLLARSLFGTGALWIGKTVLVETHWVLDRLYEFEASAINEVFVRLMGLQNVEIENRSAVEVALALLANGIEFADALHVTSRPAGARFVSFDKALVRRAKRAGLNSIAEL